MKIQIRWAMGSMVLLGAFVAGCGTGPTPQLVASYPLWPSGGIPFLSVGDGPVVMEIVYLTLEVKDPDEAAEKAARLANGCGGHENNRYAWYSEDGRAVSQEIFVPIDQAENLRVRLLQLGWKDRESIVRHSEDKYGPGYGWAQFSIQYLPLRHAIEWDDRMEGRFFQAICSFVIGAAAVIGQIAASLLLAIVVVTPCGLMIVGAFTTMRWLLRK